MKVDTYLSFKVGSEYFAANVNYINNIIEYNKVTKMPQTPSFMLGVINLRGNVLPVIDSRIILGTEKKDITTNTCILVMEITIEDKQQLIGFLVDSVSEVLSIDQEKIEEAPKLGSTVKSDLLDGIYYYDNYFILLLNVIKIFDNKQKELLTEHTYSE